jgi:hypothetical protein
MGICHGCLVAVTSSRCRWVVRLMPWLLYAQGKWTHYTLPGRLGEPSKLVLMLLRKENLVHMLEIRLIPRLSSLKHNHCTVIMSSIILLGTQIEFHFTTGGLVEIWEYCDSHEHCYINSFKVPCIRMEVLITVVGLSGVNTAAVVLCNAMLVLW